MKASLYTKIWRGLERKMGCELLSPIFGAAIAYLHEAYLHEDAAVPS